MVALDWVAFVPSSQTMGSASSAVLARHHVSATTATPPPMPVVPVVPVLPVAR